VGGFVSFLQCQDCGVDLLDDPHWDDVLGFAFCGGCCTACHETVGGGTDLARPLVPSGDHGSTTHTAAVAPAADILPAWALRDLQAHAVAVRQERLAWLVTACLWVWVLAVGLEVAS
jgi:hypothetical protein